MRNTKPPLCAEIAALFGICVHRLIVITRLLIRFLRSKNTGGIPPPPKHHRRGLPLSTSPRSGAFYGSVSSNHRHADFQSAALPTELPGLPAGGTACEDLPKPAEANGITACQHAVQREIEALPASKNSMCAGGYSCSGGLPAPASDSTIESSAPSTAGMA